MLRRLIPALTAGSLVLGMLAFTGAPASAAVPQLEAPAGLSSSTAGGDLALSWKRLDGASAYRLQIATDNTTPTLLKDVTSYAPTYVVPDAIDANEGRDLYWRVAAFGTTTTAETLGAFTGWQTLSRDALAVPVTLGPGSSDLGDPSTLTYPASVTFRWSPVPGATRYTVQYSPIADFSSNVTTAPETTATSFTPASSLARSDAATDVVWYWRVRAEFNRAPLTGSTPVSVTGGYSSARAFRVTWDSAPELLNPVGLGQKFSDLHFTWTPVVGAESYRVQLASGKSVADDALTTILDSAVVQGTTWVPIKTLTPTNYYWRVTPVDASGLDGTPSTIAQFTKFWGAQSSESAPSTDSSAYPIVHQGSPDLLQPQEIPFEDFELSWEPLSRSTLYAVTVKSLDDGDSATPEVVLTCRTASTSATVIQKMISGQGQAGAIDGASTCLWKSKTETIQVGRTYQWSVTAIDYAGASTTSLTSTTPTGSLLSLPSDPEGGSQADLLRARYIKVVSGAAEQTGSLDLNDGAWATQTSVDLKGQPAPLFDWAPMAGAGGYDVQVAVSEDFANNDVVTFRTKSTRLRATGVFDDDTTEQPYYWRVRALVDPDASVVTYLGLWSAESLSWIKQSTPVDFAGVTPVTILEDGTTLLAWRPQALSAPNDGGSRGYQIFIYNSSNALLGSAKVEYPFYAASKPGTTTPLAKGSYKFRVAALDANGLAGVRSAAQDFIVGAPAPTAPASEVATSSVSLRWTPATAASSYSVTYGQVSSTTTVSLTQTGITIADLAPGDYSWTVKSKDQSGNLSNDTAEQTFTIASRIPVATTPAEATLDAASDRLDWDAVPGASRYLVQIATSESMSATSLVAAVETTATSYVPNAQTSSPFGALTAGTQYYWNVSALPEKVPTSAARPLGTASPARAFKIVTAPAGALTVVTPTVPVITATITWTPLTDAQKGSGNALTYDVRYHETARGELLVDSSPWLENVVPAGSGSFTLTKLPINTSFELQLRARTSYGAGPWSAVKTFKTAGTPGVVAGITPSASSGGLNVAWIAPTNNGGSKVTGYVVTYRKSGGTWATLNLATTRVTLTGLTSSAMYEIKIRAENAVGIGEAAMITAAGVAAPGAPTGTKVVLGSGTAQVTWVAPINTGGTAITGYTVQTRYYTTAWSAWATKVNTTATVKTASLTGMVGARKYQVRVLAKNVVAPAGGAASAAVSFTGAVKPSAPTSVKASAYTGKIKVTWVKPALNGSTLTGYAVYRSYDRITWTKVATVSATTLTYTWTTPTKGKKYYFGVVATSNVGSSSYGTSTLTTAV